MKQALLTTLRDRTSTLEQFRRAATKLADLLAAEIAQEIEQEPVAIETPIAPFQGMRVTQEILLLPILRAGISMLSPFLRLFETAKVGFFGIRRDEETAEPFQYYENIPQLTGRESVLILDPMIATGGSVNLALTKLVRQGISPSQVTLIGYVAAPEGLAFVQKQFPQVHIKVVAVDERLNSKKFIVPGLGDFGDRFFGTA